MIREFFIPERFLKRLTMYFDVKNRLGQYKSISLFGFYKQIKKKERILNFIDWYPIEKPRYEQQLSSSFKKSSTNIIKGKTEDLNKTNTNKGTIKKGNDADDKKINLDESSDNRANNVLSFEDGKIYSAWEIIDRYEIFQKKNQQEDLERRQKEEEERRKRQQKKLKEQVFGEKRVQEEEEGKKKSAEEKFNELSKPKDKWKRGKILMQLKKKFPHDIVLQKMIKEEFKQNRVFKYPEEYDQYDDEEEYLRKYWHWDEKGLETKDFEAGKKIKEQFKVLDDQDLYYLNKEMGEKRRQEKDFEEFIVSKVNQYLEMKKNRLEGQKETLRQFVSNLYHKVKEQFSKFVDEKFPHRCYGLKKDSEAYRKSYPLSFKKYFFQMVKSFVKNKKKNYRRFRNVPPTFILPPGKRCTIHDFSCPEDCRYATMNKRVVLKSAMVRRKQRDPKTFRSRVWRRKDFKKALQNVYMLHSELVNCTFEPEAGSMSKNLNTILNVNFNLRNNGYDNEPDPDAYFNKLGKNFETSHPEVYKAGILKRAKLKYMQGKYEEAMNTLCEGFNIESIKRRFDPNYLKRQQAQQMKAAQNTSKSGSSAQKSQEDSKQKVNFLQRGITKEMPDSQKKRPEEDFDNKRLAYVHREAFDLVQTIENRKKEAEKQIRKIQKEQITMKRQMRSFSSFKKSQTRLELSKGEKSLFKSIMCPLKDKCPQVMKPRWPTSNIKTTTQFGELCYYAHHTNELRFPESILTKLSSSVQAIKNINNRMDSEKNHSIFKPAGPLEDCKGCQKCNLCKYQELANKENLKYNNKSRKESLTRSMERRQSVEMREEKKEMAQVMQALNLDENYNRKFGLLKKSCVLFFYGRYNDSFDEIAKAVKIIQEQQEIEQQKQRLIEKRWKFKLGLDDAFELPIPIEQIDINKVDEKFLAKMELNGQVSLSTVKLFIENVHPNKSEEFSKHAFLNKMIEDQYELTEAKIEDKLETIKKMKKQVEKLEEEADMLETFGFASPEKSPEKGDEAAQSQKFKKNKRVCQTYVQTGKCDLVRQNKCPYEIHNPMQIDNLIPPEVKIKNLNKVIQSSNSKLKNMKPIEPWRPAKAGEIEHTHLMDMTSKKRKKQGQEDEDEDEEHEKKKGPKKKNIFERENVFRKPYDTQE